MNNFKYQKLPNFLIFGLFYLCIACFSVILTEKLTIDERATAQMLSYPFQEMLMIVAHDVHPPLFYIIVYPLFSVGSIYSVKLFSLICGICTLFVIYDIFKINRKDFEAKILTLVVISVPNLVMHFAIARMYSLFILLEVISLNLTIRVITGKYIMQNVYLHIFLILIVRLLSLYTHFFSIIMLGFNLLVIGIHLLFLFKEDKSKNIRKQIILEVICLVSSGLSIFSLFPWIAFQYFQITGNQIHWGFFGIEGLLNFSSVMNSLHNEPTIPYPFISFVIDGFNLYGALWPQNPFRFIINIMIFGLFSAYSILGIKLADKQTKMVFLLIWIAFIFSFIVFYVFMSNYAIPHYSRYMAPVIFYLLYPLSLVDYSKTKLGDKRIPFLLIIVNIISFISFFVEYYIFSHILVN